jgi:hypothetical protein
MLPAFRVCGTCSHESQTDARADAVETVVYAAAPFEAIAVALGRGLMALEHDFARRFPPTEDVPNRADDPDDESTADLSVADPDPLGGE